MIYNGIVANGAVVLENGAQIPEGTQVTVLVRTESPTTPALDEPTMKWMLKYAGKAIGLPADMAEQHDHYLHGTPKR
ncbi:MAG TPA: hypothetical protein VH120_05485 [Gemmataceae bacterium]|jgi:hypothetical protein|nr:hypothetical protein [Gemmataceae bacterium]